jgi:hypothetical protein
MVGQIRTNPMTLHPRRPEVLPLGHPRGHVGQLHHLCALVREDTYDVVYPPREREIDLQTHLDGCPTA